MFDGCIYNHRELRANLEREGCTFFSDSDTEVIAKAWHRWGPASVERLLGMRRWSRFYLGEEPLLASVPTLDLGRPELLQEVLDDLNAFVIKPRGGSGGHGVVVCGDAHEDTLDSLRTALRRAPGTHIAQRTVTLSCVPAVVDGGRLAPRHVDLRPFTLTGRGWTRTLPGGLTRVAMDEGTLVVNSSQHGAAKDTWVLA